MPQARYIRLVDLQSLAEHYQRQTDEELLRLAIDPGNLVPEAYVVLNSELARRRINSPEQLQAFREEEQSGKDQKSKAAKKRPPWYSSDTIQDWKKYRRQTGDWPFLSIFVYALHSMIALIGLALIVWYGADHHWSLRMLVIWPLALADIVFSSWLLRKVRRHEIARHRSRHHAQEARVI